MVREGLLKTCSAPTRTYKEDGTIQLEVSEAAAFEILKTALTTAPDLKMSQDEGQYVLDVDTSNWAVAAILQQAQGDTL